MLWVGINPEGPLKWVARLSYSPSDQADGGGVMDIVRIIGVESSVESFPVLEIELETPDAIQTVEDKKHKPRTKICPADLPPETAREMTHLSIAAFRALQLRDFARVDIRMDADGHIHLLEINSMASLGGTGSYVHAAAAAGYDYAALVNKMRRRSVLRR